MHIGVILEGRVMKKAFVTGTAILTLMLGGCASQFEAPVTGQLANGTMMHGTTTARLQGASDFWAASITGLRCSGTYDAFSSAPTLMVSVVCNDRRKGVLLVTRNASKLGGTATGRLSDGTEARFVFGNEPVQNFFPTARVIGPSVVPKALPPAAPSPTVPLQVPKREKLQDV